MVDGHPARRVHLRDHIGVQNPYVHQRQKETVTEGAEVAHRVLGQVVVAPLTAEAGVDGNAFPVQTVALEPVEGADRYVVVFSDQLCEQFGLLTVAGRGFLKTTERWSAKAASGFPWSFRSPPCDADPCDRRRTGR